MPTRLELLKISLPSIIRQVDRLYLFCDGHAEVPSFVRKDRRIIPVMNQAYPQLHSAGKFLPLLKEETSSVFAGFDDDIYYPYDYVQTLLDGLRRHASGTIVGFHGVDIPAGAPFPAGAKIYHFGWSLAQDRQVDMLGSGTIAFHLDQLRFDPRSWEHKNMSDLQLALEAVKQCRPMVCLRREQGFLKALAEGQEDSIYAALRKDSSIQARLAQQLRLLRDSTRPA
jgi:hypothetical protein